MDSICSTSIGTVDRLHQELATIDAFADLLLVAAFSSEAQLKPTTLPDAMQRIMDAVKEIRQLIEQLWQQLRRAVGAGDMNT